MTRFTASLREAFEHCIPTLDFRLLLLIDNYDSFVHNLARYFNLLGKETIVVRNDAIDADGVAAMAPDAVVFSPGPCTPNEAGCCEDVVRKLHDRLPMLGVCLGHQAIAQAFGGKVVRAPGPVHGRESLVRHTAHGALAGLPNPLRVGRYHSLVVDPNSLPESLLPTAYSEDGLLMAFEHRALPIVGVQFHPESVLTDDGLDVLRGFLRVAEASTPLAGSP